jgi:hypothetical protein
MFSNPTPHLFGYSIGSLNGLVPRLSIYTCYENYGNFPLSNTSWYTFISHSKQPNRILVPYTPYGMRGKMIVVSGCLHGDCALGCFPFRCTGALDVLGSSCASHTDSSFLVMYSSCVSSCCMDPTIGCGLRPSNTVLSLSPLLILWATLDLVGCCGFLLVNGSWPYILSCESISIMIIVMAFSSYSTGVAPTSSTCGEGIVSTLMIPSLCVNYFSSFAVSCHDLWILCVFRDVCLGALTFGGAILGNFSFPD